MKWFNFDLRKTVWIAAVLLIPLISINTQKTPYDTGWFNRPFSFLASQVEGAFFSFAESVRSSVRLYVHLIGIKQELLEAKKRNSQLQAQLLGFEELLRENERLARMLAFQNRNKMQMVGAQVMSRDILEG
ncbi:MAG: rod shape-determining protein MreC, partial [Bdellovibrio sp.]